MPWFFFAVRRYEAQQRIGGFHTHRNGLKAADKRAKGNGAATNNDILEPFTLHVLWHTYCSMLQ